MAHPKHRSLQVRVLTCILIWRHLQNIDLSKSELEQSWFGAIYKITENVPWGQRSVVAQVIFAQHLQLHIVCRTGRLKTLFLPRVTCASTADPSGSTALQVRERVYKLTWFELRERRNSFLITRQTEAKLVYGRQVSTAICANPTVGILLCSA